MCIFSERTLADTSCSRCCNPCVSFVCALLYTGSSVLQTDEAPVCSLDRVPQVLACDWLLACLQVTFMFSKLHQSASSSMWLILFIQQAAIVSVFFKGMCSFLQSFQIICDWWCFSCLWPGFLFVYIMFFIPSVFCVCYELDLLQQRLEARIIFSFFPRSASVTHAHKHLYTHSSCCAVRSLLPGDHMGWQMASCRVAPRLNERIRFNQY